ncbi:MAG: thioredoxin-dependent thiol peroxidase [Calditrichaeota bacterium]|nr:MAG: thioredoxin-dependent thiol peroxidase [Calditrichota bacterium]
MLEIGTLAPDFTLPDQDGQTLSLKELRGQWVVLYFYPKDMTPGCTTEACTFQEELPAFEQLDARIIGVSKDSVKRHRTFADKHNLTFTLLSDEKGTMVEAYGAWQEKRLYGKTYWGIVRMTYIIDPDGRIAHVFPKVKPKEHPAEVAAVLRELQVN